MRPNAGDHADEPYNSSESRNESDKSDDTELAHCGLDDACPWGHFDFTALRLCSTGTDAYCALYSGGWEQWRAITDVSNIDEKERAWILR